MNPLVAIVGAPNVGKSTLFNRLVGGRRAIVTDEPGVTRDRLYGEVTDDEHRFRLVDTGGMTPHTAAPFAEEIAQQAAAAMEEAVCLLFVVDARSGLTAVDREVAIRLRRRGIPIILVANKVDHANVESLALELFELGLGEPVPVSAEHGLGVDRLFERIGSVIAAAPERAVVDPLPETPEIRVAIVGRPNVGKSSLLNRLAGEERAVISDVPGTTRDAIDTLIHLGDQQFRVIDTAGIRRRGRVQHRAERYSVVRARHNIDDCDVAVLVLDASQSFSAQDAHVAGYVSDAFKPLVVAINKWDLITDREEAAKKMTETARHRLRFAKEAPVVLISAKTGQRAGRVLDYVSRLHALGARRIPTPEINRWLQQTTGGHRDNPRGSLKIFYVTQTGIHPLTFVLFCNNPAKIHFSVARRFENSLRERFELGSAPIRLRFRARRD